MMIIVDSRSQESHNRRSFTLNYIRMLCTLVQRQAVLSLIGQLWIPYSI